MAISTTATYRPRRHRSLVGRTLKRFRVAVSVVMFMLATVLFTSVLGNLALKLQWVAGIQIFPLALIGSFTGIVIWLGITLIFGRVYCSSVCPMGVLQDIFARLNRLTRRRRMRKRYEYEAPRNKFRYTFLILVVGCAVAGLSFALTVVDPYSAFGRIGSELLLPVVEWVAGYPVAVASWLAFGIAATTLVAVAAVSWRHGRLICNTVCPVGSTLSLVSRVSMMHFDIDTDVCVNCGLCARVCKSQCINTRDHVVDSSRCVMCFNCVDICNESAIRYTFRRKRLSIPMMERVPTSAAAPTAMKIDRRQFLATGALIAASPALSAIGRGQKRISAIVTKRKPLDGLRPVAPPGRRSFSTFLEKCTGCGLCVAHCPAKVLHPAAGELGWTNLLHPVMHFDTSYCRYNCTRCTDLCPTGALTPLSTDEKHIFIIGKAIVEPSNCIGCGLCATRCPRNAIEMRVRPKSSPGPSLMVATVHTDLCIGCGACQYICPATPVKAIGVNGEI